MPDPRDEAAGVAWRNASAKPPAGALPRVGTAGYGDDPGATLRD
ncbi:MAG: hypothetical protein QJR09_02980 [Micrococcus sp.]|nr:hypothetical protein [Micrococcus sp.]